MKRFVGEGELGGTIECNIRGQGKIQVGNRNYTIMARLMGLPDFMQNGFIIRRTLGIPKGGKTHNILPDYDI